MECVAEEREREGRDEGAKERMGMGRDVQT